MGLLYKKQCNIPCTYGLKHENVPVLCSTHLKSEHHRKRCTCHNIKQTHCTIFMLQSNRFKFSLQLNSKIKNLPSFTCRYKNILEALTCLNNFIRNRFLLVLCSIPVFCSISFSFKGLGNYCNSENKEAKHFGMNVSEKRLVRNYSEHVFISGNSPWTIRVHFNSTHTYTEQHTKVNHEIRLSVSFNLIVF